MHVILVAYVICGFNVASYLYNNVIVSAHGRYSLTVMLHGYIYMHVAIIQKCGMGATTCTRVCLSV